MTSLISTSKVIRRLILRKNGGGQLINNWRNNIESGNCIHTRFLSSSSIAGVEGFQLQNQLNGRGRKDDAAAAAYLSMGSSVVQRRGFLGCGDGDEGNVLSKTYEEKIVLGYSPEQLYAVVAAVDLYEDFLPWCQRSDIVRRYPDGSFDAELEIGFKFLVESYISHVELTKPKMIKTTSSESTLFDHLINIWEFNPGPVAGSCTLHFFVDFKFQSPLYRQMASMFFKEVVTRMVRSFSDRCRLIYGPAVPVLEKTIEQSM